VGTPSCAALSGPPVHTQRTVLTSSVARGYPIAARSETGQRLSPLFRVP